MTDMTVIRPEMYRDPGVVRSVSYGLEDHRLGDSGSGEAMIDIDALSALEQAAFCAPWTAHTFEIDCPCPNGVHCGDSHTCEEVEAPQEYPHSPDDPAQTGDGQCVVQISVPGLETFAKRNAALIVATRNALPALLAEIRAAREVVESVRARSPMMLTDDEIDALAAYDAAVKP